MKYNIIGDIHGRTSWKELVIDDGINIFVGDYFSPYHKEITWEIQRDNFLDIMDYKKEHPETILLIGNHDEDHWHWNDTGCTRHNFEHEYDIRQLFEEFKDYFQAAYSIENKVLVTHAGLSIVWLYNNLYNRSKFKEIIDLNYGAFWKYNTFEEALKSHEDELEKWCKERPRFFETAPINEYKELDIAFWKNGFYVYKDEKWSKISITPDEAAEKVNELWDKNPNCFSFGYCMNRRDDCYGVSGSHSPMWIRYQGLKDTNVFAGTNYIQVYGHTIDEDIRIYYDTIWDGENYIYGTTGKMIMVDCLEYKKQSYIIKTKKIKYER